MSKRVLSLFLAIGLGLFLIQCDNQNMPTQAGNDMALSKANPSNSMDLSKGTHKKATGEVWWDADDGVDRYAKFDAHQDAPGKYSERGHLYYKISGKKSGYFKAKINNVKIMGQEAWFHGEIVEAEGFYSRWMGSTIYSYAKDAGTPGWKGDKVRFTFSPINGTPCTTFVIKEGNLKVHMN